MYDFLWGGGGRFNKLTYGRLSLQSSRMMSCLDPPLPGTHPVSPLSSWDPRIHSAKPLRTIGGPGSAREYH